MHTKILKNNLFVPSTNGRNHTNTLKPGLSIAKTSLWVLVCDLGLVIISVIDFQNSILIFFSNHLMYYHLKSQRKSKNTAEYMYILPSLSSLFLNLNHVNGIPNEIDIAKTMKDIIEISN